MLCKIHNTEMIWKPATIDLKKGLIEGLSVGEWECAQCREEMDEQKFRNENLDPEYRKGN